jgi:RimJ/RimL family protein N-acetyltransferase
VNKNIYIGADISPKFKGKGLGKLSYEKFIPFLFETYNLNKISLEVLSNNIIALNLYKKLGFVTEGVKRQEVYKNNQWVDSIIMSILKNEYNENLY